MLSQKTHMRAQAGNILIVRRDNTDNADGFCEGMHWRIMTGDCMMERLHQFPCSCKMPCMEARLNSKTTAPQLVHVSMAQDDGLQFLAHDARLYLTAVTVYHRTQDPHLALRQLCLLGCRVPHGGYPWALCCGNAL